MVIVLLVFGAILLWPIMFALKVDGDLGNTSWGVVWLPLWCVVRARPCSAGVCSEHIISFPTRFPLFALFLFPTPFFLCLVMDL